MGWWRLMAVSTLSGAGVVRIVSKQWYAAGMAVSVAEVSVAVDSSCGFVVWQEQYDPRINTWTTLAAELTVARSSFGCCVAGGKIYVVGGCGRSPLSSVEVYDPSTNKWDESLSGLHTTRHSHCCVEYEGGVWAIGGQNDSGRLNSVEIYNPDTDEWTEGPSLLTARLDAACVSTNSSLYVIGGRGGGGVFLSTTEVYDPSFNRWIRGPSMPCAIAWHTAVAVDRVILPSALMETTLFEC
jgi:hypothetical protein